MPAVIDTTRWRVVLEHDVVVQTPEHFALLDDLRVGTDGEQGAKGFDQAEAHRSGNELC